METYKAKRVAIIIEQVMQSRLIDALQEAGIRGFSILPVLGGSGRSGQWLRDGQITRGTGMVQVICIVGPEQLDALRTAAFAHVEHHMGIVTISDVEVLQSARNNAEP